MAGSVHSRPAEDQASALKGKTGLTILLLLLSYSNVVTSGRENPQQPQQLVWQVLSQTGNVVWSISHTAPPWTWWPQLSPDLCELAIGLDNWDVPEVDPQMSCQPGRCPCPLTGVKYGCRHPQYRAALRGFQIYACPRDGRSRSLASMCGGPEDYYCRAWGCETTGTVYWKPNSNWDAIVIDRAHPYEEEEAGIRNEWWQRCPHQGTRGDIWWGLGPCLNFTCNRLNITFTAKGRDDRGWLKGKQWGLRLYQSGYDRGLLMTIRLKIETLSPIITGPNKVLPPSLILHPKGQLPLRAP